MLHLRSRPARPGAVLCLALASLASAVTGCGVSLDDAPGRACDEDRPCRAGRRCEGGRCLDELPPPTDAGEDDAGRDAGRPDAGPIDAGPAPVWRQRVHGFTGSAVDATCSLSIDPARGNSVLASITSADDARDTAAATQDLAARLPGPGWGRLRGRVTLPALVSLRGTATFASVDTADGRAWLQLAFDAQGRLVVHSDDATLAAGALTERFTRDGGFPRGDYVVDVGWDRAAGVRRVALDDVTLAETPLGATGGAAAPAALRLGVIAYSGDAGSGWTVALSGWEAADDARSALGVDP